MTVKEFVWVADLGHRSSVTRWLKGHNLPRRADRRPWEADLIPVDQSQGNNYRRISVPGVKTTFWPGLGARARLDQLLGQWPAEQGWTNEGKPTIRAMAPLRLPAAALAAAGGNHAS